MGLPYDMGNAGDLLKHGVLAEFVRWQCEMGPFNEFLPRRAPAVVPQMTAMAERAAVMLFALNLDPRNPIGRRFDALLEEYLRGAWRMTCPPLRGTAVRGEARHYAEVVLAARLLLDPEAVREVDVLRTRLMRFAERLSGVFSLPTDRLAPRVVGL